VGRLRFLLSNLLTCDLTEYNPRVFPNPEVYRPSRWYDATSDDAFTAFSVGPRVCIGRKFALVEGVCFVAHMLRDYKVEPLMWKGESLDAWKERVLSKATNGMTTSISDAPLRFRRR
jgi:cytochrome P450